MSEETVSSLAEVLAKYQIEIPPKQVELLDRYCRSLWDWNTKLNLTRHTDYEKFVTRDLVDTMKLAACLQKGEHILDVGTGGGVPGLPLSILRPDLNVELCDATGKKAKAVGAIVDEVGLELNVWHAKAEELVRAHRFHTLVIRAVSRLDKLLTMFSTTWFAFDRILLIKGPAWVEERGEARHFGHLTNLALRKLDEYVNPGMEHQSVILQVCQKKRLAEIEKRAEDLAAGIPIGETVEIVAVESEKGPARQAGGQRPDRRRRSRPYGSKPQFGSDRMTGRFGKSDSRSQKSGTGFRRSSKPGGARPKSRFAPKGERSVRRSKED